MTTNPTKIVVLCEDKRHANFARYFFEHGMKIPSGRIKYQTAPPGMGAADQWVRENYPHFVQDFRSKSFQKTRGLVVIIDADEKTIRERLEQLEIELKNSEQDKRQDSERIAVFIPKWNIETWICYLLEYDVNENRSFKQDAPTNPKEYRSLVAALGQKNPYHLRDGVPRSLREACGELKRIFDDKQCIRS